MTDFNDLIDRIFECGKMAEEAFRQSRPGKIYTKLNPSDQVTDTEIEIESLLIETIRMSFPDFTIVGEESGSHFSGAPQRERIAFIDPIDGTSNFLHGIPYFSISVLFRGPENDEVGFVYDPILNKLHTNFSGFRGSPCRPYLDSLLKMEHENMSVAFISGYDADAEQSELINNKLWNLGVKRVFANWSPNLDFCRLLKGYTDAIVYCPEVVKLDDNAGRAIAVSHGMLKTKAILRVKQTVVPVHIHHMAPLPPGFVEAIE